MVRIIKNNDIVLRDIHGKFILVNTKASVQNHKIFLSNINEIGKWIWENVDKLDNIEDLTLGIMAACSLDNSFYDNVKKDVTKFVDDLMVMECLYYG